jgi:chemotaxis protein histidine kinase CheA
VFGFLKAWFRRLRGGAASGARGVVDSEDVDSEIRDVFFAELRDVSESIRSAWPKWKANPADNQALAQLRRGFHTLKGAGPIVGAHALGEFCGHVEHVLIALIEKKLKPSAVVIATLGEAVALLPLMADSVRNNTATPAQARMVGNKAVRLLAS